MDYISQNLYWIGPITILEFAFKGFALWKAAKRNEKEWFVAIFLLNTAGILPAFYLFIKK